MNLALLYRWHDTIRSQFTCLGHWQSLGLALLSLGIAVSRQCNLSKIAEALPETGRLAAVEKRLKRWIGNEDINLTLCCEAWVRWVWQQYDATRPLLLVDETKLSDWLGVMMVSLAFGQRAIPLVWCCYRANSAGDYPAQGQVLLIWGLLARVLNALPDGCRPLVQMDRGLSCSSAMFKALNNLGLDWLVRVEKHVTFTSRRGISQPVSHLAQRGQLLSCRGRLFQGKLQVKGILHILWEEGQAQPWYLLTNDTRVRGGLYARRMWQEEGFRDLKSGGWRWSESHVHTPARAERLILALALAYAWMLTLGTLVLHADPADLAAVGGGSAVQRYSVFRLGLRWFHRLRVLAPQRLWAGLFFATVDFQPRP